MTGKRLFALLLCAAMCLGLCLGLAGCGDAPAEEKKDIDVTTYYVKHNFPEEKISDTEKKITAPAGSVLDMDLVFIEYTKMDNPCDKKGTVEKVEYTTAVYEDGKTYEKFVNVYLPYGYDKNDTSKKYNVVYFQHGDKGSNSEFLTDQYQNRFDNLFASGKVDPVILVFTTFYLVSDEEAAEFRKTERDAPAGDGNYEGVPANFWMEVVQDIIPAVESKYNTYLTGTDEASVIASRDHRAFTGYSRGARCTWYMFHNALPYFRWWAPMSNRCYAGKTIAENPTDAEAYVYLKETIDANPDKPFFIYASCGGPNDNFLSEQVIYLLGQDGTPFSFGTDTSKNNLYFIRSNYAHTDFFVPYYYYNSLQVLFH